MIDKEKKFFTPAGDRYRDVYTPQINKDGSIELIVTGKEDLVELHNADRDYCDINKMVDRFEAGDLTALNRGNPVFMDLLTAPTSLAEAYQVNFRAQAAFDNLPADIKFKFNNSFMEFLSSAGTDDWFSKLKVESPESVKEVSHES